jgi:carbonic anhydrase
MKRTSIAVLLLVVFPLVLIAGETQTVTADNALTKLRDGNARYCNAHPNNWTANAEKRGELAKGQHPWACVITCSDSRVPPEMLFDQSLGDLFVIRLAGNVVTPEAVGSVEYAVEHLGVGTVVVLGHSSCGAVKATIESPEATGPVGTLVARIKPAVETAKMKGYSGDELMGAAVDENARLGAESLLRNSVELDKALKSGHLTVVCAIYDIASGNVNWETRWAAACVPGTAAEEKTVATKEAKAETAPVAKAEVKAEAKTETKTEAKTETANAKAAPKKDAKKYWDDSSTYARRHR